MSATQDLIASILPIDWYEQKGAMYSADDLIDAYYKGQKDSNSAKIQIYINAFETNLKKATAFAERLVYSARQKEVVIEKVFLRIESVSKFHLLFVATEDDYVSKKFLGIVKETREMKVKEDTSTFSIHTSFTYLSDTLDPECLASDGYSLKYAGKGKA